MRSILTPNENNPHKTVPIKFLSMGGRNHFTTHRTLGYSACALAKSKASFSRLRSKTAVKPLTIQRYFYVCNKPSYIQNMARRDGENVSSTGFKSAFGTGLLTLLRLATLFSSGAQGYKLNQELIIMMTSLLAGIVRTAVPNPILNRVSPVIGGAK
ncbi:hypothetical protein FHQ26_09550 [Testudinibacter sp. TR-2022]|uniref:hypothetical protein n=1 Tax=Testudinibacter sp. TR-2022 TaxID=2585029 RepID=UPI001119956F|nr:hypothetical protein [Testudinibacter sp. TR-2022]TNH03482.1 hypothetical protein FHQ22_07940 [Pasteurellaceae bacterium Phil31]TNH07945.1 hypothetical protein FHQ26_09550 [Testudinibacter sp. TR-2022]TNH10318.1 hypothetical protein FHQ25_05460 [Testudinibacter sp. TR-2022]